jgi:hypothetical protein
MDARQFIAVYGDLNAQREPRRFSGVGSTLLILMQASSLRAQQDKVVAPTTHSPPRQGEERRPAMRFYTQQHGYYCGIDLHARAMHVCILDCAGNVVFHKNMAANPEALLRAIAPFREDIAIAVECMFTWYRLADLCARENITFVLGHALYMKAIHGGKAKNDRINPIQSANVLRVSRRRTGACEPR